MRRATLLTAAAVTLLLCAASAHASVYWSIRGSNEVGRASNDLTYVNPAFIQNPNGNGGCGMAANSGHLFWGLPSSAKIARAGIDGSDVDLGFVQNVPGLNTPCSTVVNPTHLFWANSGVPFGVGRANLNGTGAVPNYLAVPPAPPADTVCGVAVSSTSVYWTESNNSGTISMRNINGTGTVTTISGAAALGRNACGLAVDEANNDLYWTNRGPAGTTSNIGRIDLNFSNPDLDYKPLAPTADPCDVDVSATKLYWTELGTDRIMRSDINGANEELVFLANQNGGNPCGVAVDSKTPPGPPTNLSTNPASPSAVENPSVLGQATAGATVDVFKDNPDCSGAPDRSVVANGGGNFSSGGISTDDGTSTTFRVQQTTAAGTSDCNALNGSNRVTYQNIPAQPNFTTLPASPANNTNPHVVGSGTPDGTLHVYKTANCTGPPTDGPVSGGNFDIPITVADGSVTQLSAKLTTPGGDSPCSIPKTYTELASPTVTASTPASPANELNPTISGTSLVNAAVTIRVFDNAGCTGTPKGTGTAAAFNGAGIPVSVTDGSATTFYATAAANGTETACSSTSVTYSEIPSAPTGLSTTPASPAIDRAPRVKGNALAGTVHVYKSADCTGTPTDTPSAAGTFEVAIPVTVGTSKFSATVTTAGGTSPCSASVEYTRFREPRLEVTNVELDRKRGTATLTVDSSDDGQLRIEETKNVRGSSGTVVLESAGKAELEVKARGQAKRKLHNKGRATVKPRVILIIPEGKFGIRQEVELRRD